ncbi:MAG: hypothetical protein DHS20C18_08640 [Saprospiraceae bacterium]|nr:MAG: hypothetical protein DHS20C18_08640 [Saprospiraceae bacterium]
MLHLHGLTPDQTYLVLVSDGEKASKHTLQLNKATLNKSPEKNQLKFQANSSEQNLYFLPGGPYDGKTTLTVYCEDCEGSRYEKIMAGITTTVNEDIEYLVEEVLVDGECFNIFGINSRGVTGQIGTFDNGTSSIGFEEGIILSTGHIADAIGPNDSTKTSTPISFLYNDPDLRLATNEIANLYDVAIIEFDFVPTVEQVTFEYVFASEEYCEYVNSNFNDAFGFFIRGPGINGNFFMNSDNIARIPDNGDFVSVNTVNLFNNPTYFHDNTTPNDTCYSGEAFAIDLVEYDGFTTVLTAVANVTPCSTYHIKMAIADLADKYFDSAVFLKAKSFRAGAPTTLMASAQGEIAVDTAVAPYEGCGNAFLVFERITSDLSEDYEVNFSLSPSSTATPGVDFSILPTSITIPAGQATDTLFLDIYADQLVEGTESIIIDLDGACSCITRTVEIEIHDPPPILVGLQDQSACLGETVTLTPTVSGGTPNYTFAWSDGTDGSSITVTTAETPDTITFTASDICSESRDTSVVVSAIYPHAELSGIDSICNGNLAGSLPVAFTGSAPFDLIFSIGGALDTITGIGTTPFDLPANTVGNYSLVGVQESGCPGVVSGEGEIVFHEISLVVDSTNISCTGANDGQIQLAAEGGTGPYLYAWNQGQPDTSNLQDLTPGTYEVLVSDAEGCYASSQTNIVEPQPLSISIASLENIDCDHLNGGTISTSVSGGTGTYSYLWSNDSTEAELTNLAIGNYSLTVTDQNDCSTEVSRTISNLVAYPQAEAGVSGLINCYQDEVILNTNGSSTGAALEYVWQDNLGMTIGTGLADLPWDIPGTYQFIVTDTTNNCRDTATTVVQIDIATPIVEAGPPDTLNCLITNMLLDGSNSSMGNEFSYNWTSPDGHIIGNAQSDAITVDQGGLYFLEITNEDNGCSQIDSVLITQDMVLPTVAVATFDTVNCYLPEITLDGTASSSGTHITYAWSTNNGTITSPVDEQSIQVQSGGLYTFVVSNNDNGCIDSLQIPVMQNLTLPVAEAGVSQELNCTTDNATLDGSNSFADGPLSFVWQSQNGHFTSDSLSSIVVIDSSGLYELAITDLDNGCMSYDTVIITENFSYPVAANDSTGILNCVTPLLHLDASTSVGGDQYQWSTNIGTIIMGETTPIATIDAPGTYTLVVTNSQSFCQDTAQFLISEDVILPTVLIDAPEVEDCILPSFQVNSTGSSQGPEFQYLWTSENGIILEGEQDPNLLIGSAGSYQLLIVNTANGCRDSADIQVTLDPGIPIAIAGPPSTLTCNQLEATLDGSNSTITSVMTYLWEGLDNPIDTNDQSLITQVYNPGRYILSVTNIESGCTTSDTVVVAIDTLAPISIAVAEDTLTCTRSIAQLSANASSTGPEFLYSWSSPDGFPIENADSPEANVSTPGTYRLSITDMSNGCMSEDLVEVVIDTLLPMVSILTPDTLTCAVPAVNLLGQPQSSHALSPIWTTNNGHFVDGISTFTPLVDESGLYHLLVTDLVNGCIRIVNVEVPENTVKPNAEAGPEDLLNCDITSLQLDGSGSSLGDYFYQWETDDGHIQTGANGLLPLITEPGIYRIIVTDNVNGCQSIDSTIIDQDIVEPVISILPPEELNCIRFSTTLQGNSDETNVPYQYQWMEANGTVIPGAQNLSLEVQNPGMYQWMVTNTGNGCSEMITGLVVQDTMPPIAEAGPTGILTCKTNEVQLEGASSTGENYRYHWSGIGVNPVSGITTQRPTVNTPGMYTLVVTNDANGCTAEDQVEVIEEIPRATTLSVETGPCLDDLGTILIEGVEGGFGPYRFSIDGGITFHDGPVFSGLSSGDYQVLVMDKNGCEIMADAFIPEGQGVEVSLLPQVTLDLGDTYQMNTILNVPVSTLTQISWSPVEGLSCTDCLNPIVAPEQSITYQLQVVNEDGCSGTASINLLVDRRASIYIPNGFSPYNEDGINDRFYIFAKEGLINKVLTFRVFTRWGELVYENSDFQPNDPAHGWDGLNNGRQMNPGVFVYWTEVELFDGTIVLLKGDVTLVD